MGWYGPQGGNCSCCDDCGTIGNCQCCDNGVVRDKDDITVTFGGTLGPAQPFGSTCPSAGTIPSGILADYVVSCGETYEEYFYGFICTNFGSDYYYEVKIEISYPSNADETEANSIVARILSRPVSVVTGVAPNSSNVSRFANSFGLSEKSVFVDITAGTCGTLGIPGSSTPPNQGSGYIDTANVTIAVST